MSDSNAAIDKEKEHKDENKVCELEKKISFITSQNKPPELFPYCDDVHISVPNEDNSSPPHLFPEDIVARKKLNKSLPTKSVKDIEADINNEIQIINIDSSPPEKQGEVECIELHDSSEIESDDTYVIPRLKKKRKKNTGVKHCFIGFNPSKQHRWKNVIESHKASKRNKKSLFSSFFPDTNKLRSRLREREKLRKARKRMKCSRTSVPQIVDLDDSPEVVLDDQPEVVLEKPEMLTDDKSEIPLDYKPKMLVDHNPVHLDNKPEILKDGNKKQIENEAPFVMIVQGGQVTISTCCHKQSGEKLDSFRSRNTKVEGCANIAGSVSFPSAVGITRNDIKVMKQGDSNNSFSLISESTDVEERKTKPTSEHNKEQSRIKTVKNITECIDISGEAFDVDESVELKVAKECEENKTHNCDIEIQRVENETARANISSAKHELKQHDTVLADIRNTDYVQVNPSSSLQNRKNLENIQMDLCEIRLSSDNFKDKLQTETKTNDESKEVSNCTGTNEVYVARKGEKSETIKHVKILFKSTDNQNDNDSTNVNESSFNKCKEKDADISLTIVEDKVEIISKDVQQKESVLHVETESSGENISKNVIPVQKLTDSGHNEMERAGKDKHHIGKVSPHIGAKPRELEIDQNATTVQKVICARYEMETTSEEIQQEGKIFSCTEAEPRQKVNKVSPIKKLAVSRDTMNLTVEDIKQKENISYIENESREMEVSQKVTADERECTIISKSVISESVTLEENVLKQFNPCENNTVEVNGSKESSKQVLHLAVLEGNKRDETSSCRTVENKNKVCDEIKKELSMSQTNTVINKENIGTHITVESSSSNMCSDFLDDINYDSTIINSDHKPKNNVKCHVSISSSKILPNLDRDLVTSSNVAQELISAHSPQNVASNTCLTTDPKIWPEIEDDGEEDDDDEYFTVPQRVSTGKEERDVIDGIEFLSFETERDMVEFTKIQQDFLHGTALDDGVIQSDDGLDMMDDTLAVCGDMDLQYVHQAIVPTKTNDITKIKGWRNKQFAVNDNPSVNCGLSSETYEDDDGFESCDIKLADEANMEEDQPNHWFSEDSKHRNPEKDSVNKDENQIMEGKKSSKMVTVCVSGKQKSSIVKDDVILSSGVDFKPEAVGLLKRLESNMGETKNSKSAFVSDILDKYLSSHSQLNVSYEIPKLGAEEGIIHHSELDANQFSFPSPPKASHIISEKPPVSKKIGPKPKTLAEKRKMLEQEMFETKHNQVQKKRGRGRGRPRLDSRHETSTSTTNLPKYSENLSKISTNVKRTSSPQKKQVTNLKSHIFNLDPNYKYTWIGERPIRITGSKVSREPSAVECSTLITNTVEKPVIIANSKVCKESIGIKCSIPDSDTPERHIRIADSKLFKKVSAVKSVIPPTDAHSNISPEIKQERPQILTAKNKSNKIQYSHEVCTDNHSKIIEQNEPENETNPCEDNKTLLLSTDLKNNPLNVPEFEVSVSPSIGHPLHPTVVKQLMLMRSGQIYIDKIWANFAASVVTTRKDISTHHSEKQLIPMKYANISEDVSSVHELNEIHLQHSKIKFVGEKIVLCKQIPIDPNLSPVHAKTNRRSLKQKLSNLAPEPISDNILAAPIPMSLDSLSPAVIQNSKEESAKDLSCVSPDLKSISDNMLDEVQLEVRNILKDMLQCILNHEIEDSIVQDDPDGMNRHPLITPKSGKTIFNKERKKKVYRELNRLDVNLIVMGDEGNGLETVSEGTSCEKDFCQLGCLCNSLQNCHSLSTLLDHCGKSACMFECSCKIKESSKVSFKQMDNNISAEEKPSLLYCTLLRLQDEENRHLAKIEKEFRHTVIQSNNEMIVMRGSSRGDGGRRKREIKLPERYRDSSVVLGKEFAMAEFKMIAGDDMNNVLSLPDNSHTKRSEKQLSDYVEVGVSKPVQVSVTKASTHKLTKGKLTQDQKISLWCERFKVKPCEVKVERTQGLDGVIPWCMVHYKYDCFCSGQSLKPFKRVSSQPLGRPPPIPGPPLDFMEESVCKREMVVKHKSRISRNVAVKSTSLGANIHSHDVLRHSARTNGTTMNYVIRNQSHYFRNHYNRLYHSELQNVNLSSNYSECSISRSGNKFHIKDVPFIDDQPPLFLPLNEQVTLTNYNLGDEALADGEELGFAKIVSIKSLKPEEFERCETANDLLDVNNQDDQLLERDVEASNMDTTDSETNKLQYTSDETNMQNLSSTAAADKLFQATSYVGNVENVKTDKCFYSLTDLFQQTGSKSCHVDIRNEDLSPPINKQLLQTYSEMNNKNIILFGKYCPVTEKLLQEYTKTNIVDRICSTKFCTSVAKTFEENKNNTQENNIKLTSNEPEVPRSGRKLEIQLEEKVQNNKLSDVLANSKDGEQIPRAPHILNTQADYQDDITLKNLFIPLWDNKHEPLGSETSNNDAQSCLENSEKSGERVMLLNEEPESKQNEEYSKTQQYHKCSSENKNTSLEESVMWASAQDPQKPLGPQLVLAQSRKTADTCISKVSPSSVNNLQLTVANKVLNKDDGDKNMLSNSTVSKHCSDDAASLSEPSNHSTLTKDIGIPLKEDYISEKEVMSPSTIISVLDQNNSKWDYDNSNLNKISNRDGGNMTVGDSQDRIERGVKNSSFIPSTSESDMNSGNSIRTSGVEVPLPTGPEPARWYMLNIRNRFDLLHLAQSKCVIRYAQLIRAISLANSHGKTVRVPLEKKSSKGISFSESNQPKFGVYTVPNLYTRVFIGPYGLREEAGVSAIKAINGKLVNTMFLDSFPESPAEINPCIISLMGGSGKEADLNKQMEELYDSIAHAPKIDRNCRGMWLYTSRSADKTNSIGNVGASVLNLGKTLKDSSVGNERYTSFGGSGKNKSSVASEQQVLYHNKKLSPDLEKSKPDIGSESRLFGDIKNTELHTDPGKEFRNRFEKIALYSDLKKKMKDIEMENHRNDRLLLGDGSVISVKKQCSENRQSSEVRYDPLNIIVHKIAGDKAKANSDFEENEKNQQILKNKSELHASSSAHKNVEFRPENEGEELLDVETPCNTGTVFRERQLLMTINQPYRDTRSNNYCVEQHNEVNFESRNQSTASATESDAIGNELPAISYRTFSTFKSSSYIVERTGVRQTMHGSKIMTLGKTAISIKLVPSITSVGYIAASMYHNKSVLLKNPFTTKNEQVYFQNLETATKWLTDELKRKLEFAPEDRQLVWRVKHATVNVRGCQPFDSRILDGNHVVTPKGLQQKERKVGVFHAINEKQRREEIVDEFERLGVMLMSKQAYAETSKLNLLEMAVKEIQNLDLANKKLEIELNRLRKLRITNFAKFYKKVKALPFSVEEKKKEMNALKEIFENYSHNVPVVNETVITDSETNGRKSSRISQDSSECAENELKGELSGKLSSEESSASDYLTDEKDSEDSNTDINNVNREKPFTLQSSKQKDEENDTISIESILNKDTTTSHSLRLKDDKDDSVSVSISVVRCDEPVSLQSGPKYKDIVTVTRISHCSNKDNSLCEPTVSSSNIYKPLNSNACDSVELKINTIENENRPDNIVVIPDSLEVIPLNKNENILEKDEDNPFKMDGFLGFPSPGKEPDAENSEPFSPRSDSSYYSNGFLGFQCLNEKSRSEEDLNTDFQNVDRNLEKSSSELPENKPFTAIEKERLSVTVDNDKIDIYTLLDLKSVVSPEPLNKTVQSLQTSQLKSKKRNIAESNETSLGDEPPTKVKIVEVNKEVQKKAANIINVSDKDNVAHRSNPVKTSSIIEMFKNEITEERHKLLSSLLKSQTPMHNKLDTKFVICNTSKPSAPVRIPSGSKVGYHIVSNKLIGRNKPIFPKPMTDKRNSSAPVYVTVVASSSSGIATKTATTSTTTASGSTIGTNQVPQCIQYQTANGSSNQKHFVPQITGTIGVKPVVKTMASSQSHTFLQLQAVPARTVCVSGNKVVTVQGNSSKYVVQPGKQLFLKRPVPGLKPIIVSTVPSSVSTVIGVTNSNKNIGKGGHTFLTTSVLKPLSSSRCSTNSMSQPIKLKRLSSEFCTSDVPNKFRKLTGDLASGTTRPIPVIVSSSSSFPKLATTLTTYTNSTTSHILKPGVVNTSRVRPTVSVLTSKIDSDQLARTVVSNFTPVTEKLPFIKLHCVKKNLGYCYKPVSSSNSESKMDIPGNLQSLESLSSNLDVSPPTSNKLSLQTVANTSCKNNTVVSSCKTDKRTESESVSKDPFIAEAAKPKDSSLDDGLSEGSEDEASVVRLACDEDKGSESTVKSLKQDSPSASSCGSNSETKRISKSKLSLDNGLSEGSEDEASVVRLACDEDKGSESTVKPLKQDSPSASSCGSNSETKRISKSKLSLDNGLSEGSEDEASVVRLACDEDKGSESTVKPLKQDSPSASSCGSNSETKRISKSKLSLDNGLSKGSEDEASVVRLACDEDKGSESTVKPLKQDSPSASSCGSNSETKRISKSKLSLDNGLSEGSQDEASVVRLACDEDKGSESTVKSLKQDSPSASSCGSNSETKRTSKSKVSLDNGLSEGSQDEASVVRLACDDEDKGSESTVISLKQDSPSASSCGSNSETKRISKSKLSLDNGLSEGSQDEASVVRLTCDEDKGSESTVKSLKQDSPSASSCGSNSETKRTSKSKVSLDNGLSEGSQDETSVVRLARDEDKGSVSTVISLKRDSPSASNCESNSGTKRTSKSKLKRESRDSVTKADRASVIPVVKKSEASATKCKITSPGLVRKASRRSGMKNKKTLGIGTKNVGSRDSVSNKTVVREVMVTRSKVKKK